MSTLKNEEGREPQLHQMPFGAEVQGEGVRFRLFAPAAETLRLQLDGEAPVAMVDSGEGWFELNVPDAAPGTRYRFLLPDGTKVPDPASRYQPEDVHGPSEVVDPAAYAWNDHSWKGMPWEQSILYELHVGAFMPEGTFRAAAEKLDHIAGLGVTAIELMCLADFAGNRNWGYDGVLLYAPDSAYGRPEDVKAFVDAAHTRGLMVILDVVYNHFGPEGDYLPKYMPQLCSKQNKNPWGAALNFDGEGCREVREFVLHNAAYWIKEFHIDGLRLDASHAMIDHSPKHILDELRERVLAAAGDRQVHLILEHEHNIAARLVRDASGKPEGYSAQWNHDITHLLAAVLGKPCSERKAEDAGETERLGKALAGGFVIATEEQESGEVNARVPPTGYVSFIQTHDLIGNRIFGERITQLAPPQAVRAIAAIYLLSPQIPMLFMGEEWSASTPFPFFCDYHGALADAVRKGRCDQLSKLDPAPSAEEMKNAPDPQVEGTFRSAQLDWDEVGQEPHAGWLAWYKGVLLVRSKKIAPLLIGLAETCGEYSVFGPGQLCVDWSLRQGKKLHLAVNLCDESSEQLEHAPGELLWCEGTADESMMDPWSVRWSLEG